MSLLRIIWEDYKGVRDQFNLGYEATQRDCEIIFVMGGDSYTTYFYNRKTGTYDYELREEFLEVIRRAKEVHVPVIHDILSFFYVVFHVRKMKKFKIKKVDFLNPK